MAHLFGKAAFQWNDHNLVPWSEDLDEWAVSGTPTLATGLVDAYGVPVAWRITDDAAGAEYVVQTITFAQAGEKAIAVDVREGSSVPAGGSQILLRDNTAGAARIDALIDSWSGGEPSVVMSTGSLLWKRQRRNSLWRLAFASSGFSLGNAHELRLRPAAVDAQTGDVIVGSVHAVDVATIGGYYPTRGAAVPYSGSYAPPQQYLLPVPLQRILPAGSVWRGVRESASRKVREVVSSVRGVHEITAELRYLDDPATLGEMIMAGVRGVPLAYIPDTDDMDTAFEFELLEPGDGWSARQEVDFHSFKEPALSVRFRRRDGGTMAGLF